MNSKKYCFSINSYLQALTVLKKCKLEKIQPIIHIKNYLIIGLGIDWLLETKNMLEKENILTNLEFFIDVKNNYGLFISLVEKRITYLKVKGDKKVLIRLRQIAKLNKVSINPNFSILDLSRTKNIAKKIENIIK